MDSPFARHQTEERRKKTELLSDVVKTLLTSQETLTRRQTTKGDLLWRAPVRRSDPGFPLGTQPPFSPSCNPAIAAVCSAPLRPGYRQRPVGQPNQTPYSGSHRQCCTSAAAEARVALHLSCSKDAEPLAKTMQAYLRRAPEGTPGQLIMEMVILLRVSSEQDSNRVLAEVAKEYNINVEAIAAAVRKEFAARKKTRAEKRPERKPHPRN